MSVHLIYRTPYNHLNNKFYKKFPEPSVLKWVQSLWKFYDDDPHKFYTEVSNYIGIEIYGFWGVFWEFNEEEPVSNKIPPDSFGNLEAYLAKGYYNVIDSDSESYFQVLTDDDELELAYYVFDDYYASQNSLKVRYLIQGDYLISEEFHHASPPKQIEWKHSTINAGLEEGATFLLQSRHDAGDNLSSAELNLVSFNGLRLPSFLDYVMNNSLKDIILFRVFASKNLEQTVKNILNFEKHWCFEYQQFYEDFSYDEYSKLTQQNGYLYFMKAVEILESKIKKRGLSKPKADGDVKFQYSEHLIQLSINSESWDSIPIIDSKPAHLYNHIVLFDDMWESSNSVLASSMIKFFEGWKVLK